MCGKILTSGGRCYIKINKENVLLEQRKKGGKMKKMRVWLEGLLDTPLRSPRGRPVALAILVVFVLLVLFFVLAYSSWAINREIAAATAPWREYSAVEMTLRPLGISEIEIVLTSAYQRDEMKLLVLRSVEAGGVTRVVAQAKYFTLPRGETKISLPVSQNWVKIRVILYHSGGYSDRLITEAEILKQSVY